MGILQDIVPFYRSIHLSLNTMYCELCGSPSHNTNQCHALDALADRLDRSAFRVNEGPQGPGGGQEVEVDTEVDELVEEDQFIATIVMSKGTW
jgi:hypothetical protein